MNSADCSVIAVPASIAAPAAPTVPEAVPSTPVVTIEPDWSSSPR
jgi:hypothetical protein